MAHPFPNRQNLFALVEQAANGDKVEFVHKGQVFQIVQSTGRVS